MAILCWNIRGLGIPEKRSILKELIIKSKSDIICIQETKKSKFTNRFLNSIATNFSWNYISSIGASGGILMGISTNVYKVLSWNIGIHTITAIIQNKTDGLLWACTNIYGPVINSQRQAFWNELEFLSNLWTDPWVLCGDFNVIRGKDERKGVSFDANNIDKFNNWIEQNNFIDYKCPNKKFTWARGGTSNQQACLDRFLVNLSWSNHYPNVKTYCTTKQVSDHNPIIMNLGTISQTVKPPFRFEKYWLNQPDFEDRIKNWWNSLQMDTNASYWPHKMKFIKQKLKGWSANLQKETRDKKQQLTSNLDYFESLAEDRDLSDMEISEFYKNKTELLDIFKDETTYWQQRSNIDWFKDGDANTQFFHKIASFNRAGNTITSLEINGQTITDISLIEKEAFTFFRKLLGYATTPTAKFNDTFWANDDLITQEENIELVKPFSIEEIYNAIQQMHPDKAPGPDGMPILFYQKFWHVIKDDVVKLFNVFYNNTLDVSKINRALICLIPKNDKCYTTNRF